MVVVWCHLFLLYVGLSLTEPVGAIYDFSNLNCTSLCGLPFKAAGFYQGDASHIPNRRKISVNFNGSCIRESELSLGSWNKSARRFLQLMYTNETWFDCPKWNIVDRKPNETELPKFWTKLYFKVSHGGKANVYESRYRTSIVEPAGIPGQCDVFVDRGVVNRDSSVFWMEAYLEFGGKRLTTIGSIVSLWIQSESTSRIGIQPYLVHLRQNETNGCQGNSCTGYQTMWLPASTFGTSVPYKGNTTQHYSIYAPLNFQQIPGFDGKMDEFGENVAHLENVVAELLPSNIAILSLPLLMAMLPISLFQEVSSAATGWYVFVSDVLVAVPMLIKGIELIIVYRKTKVKMYSTLSMTGPRYGVYERWYAQCYPPVGITYTVGIILISLALWFMIASSYAEFAFWRAIQYRHGRLNIMEEIPSDVIDEESEGVNERKLTDSERRNNSWYARLRNHILAGSFVCLIALFIGSITTRIIASRSGSPGRELVNSSVLFLVSGRVKCFTIILLVFFHMIGTNLFSPLRPWMFFGIVFGVVGGPLYLILHLKKRVRESQFWGDVSNGANIGTALLGTLLALFLGGFFPFHLMFTWLYGGAIVVLHAIRSYPSDRVRWRYGLNGFAAGMLFGPFGIFLKRCFPETTKDKQARANFHGGFAFGVIFLLTVVNLIASYWEYLII